jgi:hypothetical protein
MPLIAKGWSPVFRKVMISTEAEIFWYKVSLGTALESKSSDLDVFEPGKSVTATFPNLKIWTPATFPKIPIIPENS